MLKIRLLNSFTPKALLVTVAAGAVFLIGGVANADTPQGPQDSGSSTGGLPLTGAGGLDLGHLVGPILQPILGGPAGGTGGLDLGHLVGPILQPILGGPAGGTGGLDLGHLVGSILQPILGGPAGGTGGLGLGQLIGPILGGLGS